MSSSSYEAAIRIVKEARERAGLSQRELALRLSKPPSYVAKLETRARRLDMVEFIAVAEALGLSAADLMAEVAGSLTRPLEI